MTSDELEDELKMLPFNCGDNAQDQHAADHQHDAATAVGSELSSQPNSKNEASRAIARKAFNLRRIDARDRRLAAIHEAGHHVIARYHGMDEVESWIERVGDPTVYNNAWVGRTRWLRPSDESSRRDAMIALAGMVAENQWRGINDPDRIGDIYDLLDDPDCMSETDWCTAGMDHGARLTETQMQDIESVIDLLSGPLWSKLLRQARRLITESRDHYTCDC